MSGGKGVIPISEVRKGVRQGFPLSPPGLFSIFIDRVVSEARNKFYGI